MFYAVFLIVDDPDKCYDTLSAWEAVGVRGITILDSTGLGRLKQSLQRDDLPLIPTMRKMLGTLEEKHRTIVSVVQGEAILDQMAAAAEAVLGKLDAPNTGFMFAIPVARIYGIRPSENLET